MNININMNWFKSTRFAIIYRDMALFYIREDAMIGYDEMRYDEMRYDEMRWDEMRWFMLCYGVSRFHKTA